MKNIESAVQQSSHQLKNFVMAFVLALTHTLKWLPPSHKIVSCHFIRFCVTFTTTLTQGLGCMSLLLFIIKCMICLILMLTKLLIKEAKIPTFVVF